MEWRRGGNGDSAAGGEALCYRPGGLRRYIKGGRIYNNKVSGGMAGRQGSKVKRAEFLFDGIAIGRRRWEAEEEATWIGWVINRV